MLRLVLQLLPAVLFVPMIRAQDCVLEIGSLDVTGQPANNDSGDPSLSFDGRFVAYASVATDLVLGDTNGMNDCFVTDRTTGIAERVSVNNVGLQGNGPSWAPRISADCRFVVFLSDATNLDPKDTDTVRDVFIHDRIGKTTTLVSERFGSGLKLFGCIRADPSSDGHWVSFVCTDNDVLPGVFGDNAYVRDAWLGTTELASVGPAGQVAFYGGENAHISGDGRYVVFQNSELSWGTASAGAQSALWLRDRQLGTTSLITATASGEIANCGFGSPVLSLDGRFAVFWSCSSNLLPPAEPHGIYDIVRWDRLTGEFRNVSKTLTGQALSNQAGNPGISADGTRVVYSTYAVGVTSGLQISPSPYVVDPATQTTRCLLVNAADDVANASSLNSAVSGDGRSVAFDNSATNLVRGITTNATQVYVRSCDKALPMAYCTAAKGTTGCKVRLGSTGEPSSSAGAGFDVRVESAPAAAPTLIFYGTSGPWGQLLPQGWLCVKSPLKRAQAGVSSGGMECSSTWSLDFNAFVAGGADPALDAGAVVHLQAWTRNALGDGQLSDALALVLAP